MAINLCNYAGGRISKGGAMPNWKEAFEEVLARGGNTAPSDNCLFCKTSKDCTKDCPLDGAPNQSRITCSDIFGRHYMDDSERRAICRHVLATVKDFTDRNEIRARIAEMLADPEKFLGKAEPEKVRYDKTSLGSGYEWPTKFRESLRAAAGELRHVITQKGNHWPGSIIAAFRDEKLRDRVLELLRGEAK